MIRLGVLILIGLTNLDLSSGANLACPSQWKFYSREKTCIKAFNDKKVTWDAARDLCRRDGADFVTIRDNFKQRFVTTVILNGQYYWIGMRDSNHDGKFKYLNGEDLTYEAWGEGEPNKGFSEDQCVEIFAVDNGAWNNEMCWRKNTFVCEIPATSANGLLINFEKNSKLLSNHGWEMQEGEDHTFITAEGHYMEAENETSHFTIDRLDVNQMKCLTFWIWMDKGWLNGRAYLARGDDDLINIVSFRGNQEEMVWEETYGNVHPAQNVELKFSVYLYPPDQVVRIDDILMRDGPCERYGYRINP